VSWQKIDADMERRVRLAQADIARAFRIESTEFRKTLLDLADKYGESVEGWTAYNRMQSVNKLFSERMGKAYEPLREIIEGTMSGVYTASYSQAMPLISQAVGATVRGGATAQSLQTALRTPMGGLTVDLRLDRWQADITRRLQEHIVSGLQRGESLTQISRGISAQFGENARHLQQIVMTESHRMENRAILDAGEHATAQGHDVMKMWVSERDELVRDSHQELDGVKIPLDEDFVSSSGGRGPAPGEMGTAADDINCRCTIKIESAENNAESEDPKDPTMEEKKKYLESVVAMGDDAWTHPKFKDGIHISKLSAEDVDRVYQGVKSVSDQFPVKFTGITSDRSLRSAHGEYVRSGQPLRSSKAGYIQLDKKSFTDRVDFKETDKYISKRWSISDAVGKEGMKATTQHEALHGVYFQNDLSRDWDHQLFKRKLFSSDFGKVSEYPLSVARKRDLPRAKAELFSEVGTAILNNIDIPQEFIDAFNATVEGIRKK
jgi:hypothetical protein